MIEIRRAADRFTSAFDGVRSRHSFAAGAHYDPDNVAFGPLVACDEHVLAPGAGFVRHAHTRVELVSWVLDGALRHEGPAGRAIVVGPGEVQHQVAGRRTEHVERNASADEPLRFVQFWLTSDADDASYAVRPPPVALAGATFDVVRRGTLDAPFAHVFATGACVVGGHALGAGDTARVRDEAVPFHGAADLLVITVESRAPSASGAPRFAFPA